MPVTPGDFTASKLGKIQFEMEKMFRGSQIDTHLNQPVSWFQALFENQQFSLDQYTQVVVDGYDGRAFQGTWLQMCDMTTVETSTYAGNSTDCTIDGDEVGSQTKSYTPNIGFYKEFKVEEDSDYHDNLFSMEQKIARGMLTTLTALDLQLEAKLIASLDAAADTITIGDFTGLGIAGATAKDTNTTVDLVSGDFTQDLIMSLAIYAEQKDFQMPKLLNGQNLYKIYNLAQFNADPNKTYEALMMPNGPLPMVWNIKTPDVQLSNKVSFLVDNANIAYFNTRRHVNEVPKNQQDGDNTHTFSIRSPRLVWRNGSSLQPVYYDVKRQRKCIGNDRWAEVFRVEHNGGIVYGPEACSGAKNMVVRLIDTCVGCAA